MSFKEKDFIEINYTAYDAEKGTVLSTTYKDKAKEGDIYDDHINYGPTLIILGSHAVVPGLEKELMNMNEGESKTFVLEPKDAFGERRKDLIGVMPISQFRENKIDPQPGMQINIDNSVATVVSVGSGRVVVDRNHPDAGKSIKYEVEVIKQLKEDKEKIEGLTKTYNVQPSRIEKEGDKFVLYYDPKFKKNADYFIGKANALSAIFAYVDGISKMNVVEEYENSIDSKVDNENSDKTHEDEEAS